MSYAGEKRFRIDLGVVHQPQPCDEHAKKTDAREAGYEVGCVACEKTPEREVAVPHLEGFYVEVLNPDLLPYGRKKELYPPLPQHPTARELQERRERIVAGLITNWNLLPVDVDEGEVAEVLPLPHGDPGKLDRAPEIVNQVMAGIGRASRLREPAVPKASATR